jgi:hypothetical protein
MRSIPDYATIYFLLDFILNSFSSIPNIHSPFCFLQLGRQHPAGECRTIRTNALDMESQCHWRMVNKMTFGFGLKQIIGRSVSVYGIVRM